MCIQLSKNFHPMSVLSKTFQNIHSHIPKRSSSGLPPPTLTLRNISISVMEFSSPSPLHIKLSTIIISITFQVFPSLCFPLGFSSIIFPLYFGTLSMPWEFYLHFGLFSILFIEKNGSNFTLERDGPCVFMQTNKWKQMRLTEQEKNRE